MRAQRMTRRDVLVEPASVLYFKPIPRLLMARAARLAGVCR
jgi:hypothetical protein